MVSLQLEDGICAADVPPNEACAHSTAMTFQCNPAFAPPGRPTLPFATINMRFTDTHRSGQPCCQVDIYTLPSKFVCNAVRCDWVLLI